MIEYTKTVEYIAKIKEHKNLVDISLDINPLHSDEKAAAEFRETYLKKFGVDIGEGLIVQGAHLLGMLESHPNIIDHYLVELRKITFESPLAIKDEKKLEYTVKTRCENKTLTHEHDVLIKDGNRRILSGKIFTIPDYYVFKMEILDKLNHVKEADLAKPKIGDIKITEQIIRDYCKNLHIDETIYKKKYQDRASGMLAAFFIPGKLISLLKDLGDKKIVYARQNLIPGIGCNEMSVYGEKPDKPSDRYKINVFIRGLEGMIVKSETFGMAL